jgi:hypothetical protein
MKMRKKLNEKVEPALFEAIENGEVESPDDLLVYLELREAIIKGLLTLKRGNKVNIYGACVVADNEGNASEFIIRFGYKGMSVSLKGLIGLDEVA